MNESNASSDVNDLEQQVRRCMTKAVRLRESDIKYIFRGHVLVEQALRHLEARGVIECEHISLGERIWKLARKLKPESTRKGARSKSL